MRNNSYEIHSSGSFEYIEEGPDSAHPPVVLLHGMLGDLTNWDETVKGLSQAGFRVLVPVLPVYDMPLRQTNVRGLADYVRDFSDELDLGDMVLIGNSLGGHVALIHARHYPERTSALVLSGSSGIYEVDMGTSTPRRHDKEFIREKAALTFYNDEHVTDELVDDMYDIVTDRARVLRLIKMARATRKEVVTDFLSEIDQPTLLIWGQNDKITPPDVAEQFRKLLPDASLELIDKCGHAPMMEHPRSFNEITLDFLANKLNDRENNFPVAGENIRSSGSPWEN